MWQFLLHLWQAAPANLQLPSCPPPATGQAPDPEGFFDPDTVAAAFNLTAVVSVAVVALAVAICYQTGRGSLGRKFVTRWWAGLVAASLACFASAWIVLATAPTTAMADTCSTNPTAFPASLPTSLVMNRSFAGLVWGALAYAILSLVMTKVALGWLPHEKNGFFHNRGCPWPRVQP